ncbi:MAG: hypothetical protein NTZ34_01495, partial [Chloroflexi bacterium]|nr:hypothetical protein [Chloroflexota bacterium]
EIEKDILHTAVSLKQQGKSFADIQNILLSKGYPVDIIQKGLKLIFMLPPALIFISVFIISKFDAAGIYVAAGAAVVMAILYVFILPIKYCILNNKIRIEFRGPLAFNIPFETVTGVRDPRWFTAGINLPTNMSQSSALEIARKGRVSVNITPADKQAFVSNFDKAFQDWKKGKDI